MNTTRPIVANFLTVEGRETRVHVGGSTAPGAEALLLLHGGWGDAALHWSPIWDRLGERFRVFAPELPGFGNGTAAGPLDLPAFAEWCARLLDALAVDRAWVVGNGFGGGIGWQLATVARARVRGLVLLNGGPPPFQPWLMVQFLKLRLARGFLRHALRTGLYGPQGIARGFADPAHAPAALASIIAQPEPPALATLVEVTLRAGFTNSAPRVPVLMIWGEADRLPGTDALAMDRLQAVRNPPIFESMPGAGHLPQLERPGDVVDRILAFAAPPVTSPAP